MSSGIVEWFYVTYGAETGQVESRMPRRRPLPIGHPHLTVLYVGPGVSPPTQAAVAAWATAQGTSIAQAIVAQDAGRVGTRDSFVGLAALVEQLHAGRVLTPGIGDLAENPVEHALVVRVLARAGATWHQLEPDVPWDRALVDLMVQALVDHESLVYRPKINLGLTRTPRERAGPPPWGHERDERGVLRPLPGVEAAIQEAIVMRRNGASLAAVAARLEARGVVPGKVYPSTVTSILRRATGGTIT